jgi:hypothetical protein
MVIERKFWKNIEGKGRGIFHNVFHLFVWKEWEKSRKISVRVVGVSSDIQTRHLPKERQKP